MYARNIDDEAMLYSRVLCHAMPTTVTKHDKAGNSNLALALTALSPLALPRATISTDLFWTNTIDPASLSKTGRDELMQHKQGIFMQRAWRASLLKVD